MMSQVKLTCGFEKVSVPSDFFRSSTVGKGIELFEANHVGNVVEIRNISAVDICITGKCLSQVRTSTTYQINLKVISNVPAWYICCLDYNCNRHF